VGAVEERVDPAAGERERPMHLLVIALSVAMSKSPRPIPDWFVAMTTRNPAWLSRAIASRLPGWAATRQAT
jgi:hypothetical protein